MQVEVLTPATMGARETELKQLLSAYYLINKDIFDANTFFEFVSKGTSNFITVLILDEDKPIGYAFCEIFFNELNQKLTINIWNIYASITDYGQVILSEVEKIAKGKKADLIGYWAAKPKAFEKLCKKKGVGFKMTLAYFEKEINKEESLCHQ